MTKKQIIAIADAAYGDGHVALAHAVGADVGDTLARFVAIELRETYVKRAPAVAQLEEARRVMCMARRELQAVERAFEVELEKQKSLKEI